MSLEREETRTALVSGGSRGLGGALVRDLRRRGYRVATFSRASTPFLEAEQNESADAFYWAPVDATDLAQVHDFIDETNRRFGRIDVLINNAGVGLEGLLTLTRPADIQRTLQLNLELAIFLTRGCIKSMLRSNGGHIINISSVNAVQGNAGVSVYSATKAALDGLTRSLAREVGPAGIRVNSVAPGYFESEMTADMPEHARERIVRRTPLGRLGSVDDLVGVVRFLLSPEAAFITGQTLVVDGGISC